MCGRHTVTQVDGLPIAERFGVRDAVVEGSVLGRFNVCPTEPVPAITGTEGASRLSGRSAGPRPASSARSAVATSRSTHALETLFTRSPFASLAGRADRRCLVVADGWYEGCGRSDRAGRGSRSATRSTAAGSFAFAGLWDVRRVGGVEVVGVRGHDGGQRDSRAGPRPDGQRPVVPRGRSGVALRRARRRGGGGALSPWTPPGPRPRRPTRASTAPGSRDRSVEPPGEPEVRRSSGRSDAPGPTVLATALAVAVLAHVDDADAGGEGAVVSLAQLLDLT